jgi:superfamily II DNA or RNA helicase
VEQVLKRIKMKNKKIEIIIDNRLRIRLDKNIPRELQESIRKRFEHSNPEYYKLKSMGYKAWGKDRIIKTWKHEETDNAIWELTLPRGGMQRLRDLFDNYKLEWTAYDDRSEGKHLGTYVGDWVTGDIFPEHKLPLWDHQIRIVDAIEEYENCLVRAPTGSGKSIAIIAAMARIQLPTIIIVWSNALLKQWIDCIHKEFNIPKKDIGIIQGSKCKLKPVTVGMQQTLNRYDKKKKYNSIRDVFGFVVADEVQKFGAKTFMQTIDQFNSVYRVGVSADETRKDKKEFLIYDMFGRVAEDISKKELVNKQLIHDVEIRVIPTEFRADWYKEARLNDQVPDFKVLIDEMIDDSDRNEVLRQTISMVAKKKYRMLVFSQRVDHCKRIDTLVTASGYKSGLLIGGVEFRDLFDDTKNGLMDGSRQIGIGTLGGGSSVGLDLPQVSHGVLATPIHNNKQFLNQVTGRLCRIAENKKDAQIYILWDQYVFGKRPLMNFKKWFSTVKVKKGNRWVDVNKYLEGYKGYEKKENQEEGYGADSIFTSADKLR